MNFEPIITCAVTGAGDTTAKHSGVPVTPKEIADAAIEAAKAGAAVAHIHVRDPETGNSKGFAFINFASFEAADAALEAMNGQYLCNRAISISYAFKKESKGERHGTAAGATSKLRSTIG